MIILLKLYQKQTTQNLKTKFFFINLGGYKEGEFEEFHYKMLAFVQEMSQAVKKSKETSFYKHCAFKGATSHIDDKFRVDVDNIYNVREILELDLKEKFELKITKSNTELAEDPLHIGYLKLEKIY